MKALFCSSIGRKFVVGITGLVLIGFVVMHLLGNLQVFLGPSALNDYSEFLHSIPGPLWVARIVLIASFVLHVVFAIQLKMESLRARPERYVVESTVQATVSSRVMALTGSLVLLYVIGHLLHFTFGIILPEYFERSDSSGRADVYSMVVLGFKHPIVSWSYIVAMLLLWSHLSHGISSVFQTLGFRTPKNACSIEALGAALSTIIVLGYISIPLAVIFKVIDV